MTTAVRSELAPYRPGPRAWGMLVGAEAKMVLRDTAGLLTPIMLPMLILVMAGFSAEGESLPNGVQVIDFFVIPLVLTIVLSTIGVLNMPGFLALYRRAGILRRLAVTPARPAMVLVAHVVVSIAHTVVGIGLALAVAVLAFGANLPAKPGLALAVVALAALTMYSVGLLVAAVAHSPNAAVAIGLVLFFGMGAGGGLFGSPGSMPEVVARIGETLPFGASVHAVGAAWVGTAPEPRHLLCMAAAIVVSALVSTRFFRWQ
ncbi:ABC transporter permease [Nonomuraea terrae]|uniref:ABC transporter permease n=1 Tax=Nonomuraea terrae TaxID=2530383 RepID=A0A4R4YIB1_9ACTN|nr:ABC transporter permease [Nonomuraea terrae]TDD44635.1 ABC transporter permease [Nonomuraea terrae]